MFGIPIFVSQMMYSVQARVEENRQLKADYDRAIEKAATHTRYAEQHMAASREWVIEANRLHKLCVERGLDV